jgi:cytochrome c-type biogenesis protein CcsB
MCHVSKSPGHSACDSGTATRTVKVKNFFRNPVVAFFASMKLGAVLMVIVGIASGIGTFIESFYGGRDAAYAQIYAARWFEIVLGLLILNLTLIFFKRMPYSPRQSGSAVIHVSIVVILLSSAITRYFGYEGVVPIREGQSADYFYTDRPHVQVDLGGDTGSYPVRLFKPGTLNMSKKVHAGGKTFQLGVSEYWPYFTETYQEGEGGPPGFQFGMSKDGSIVNEILLQGDRKDIGKARAWYRHDHFSGELSQSRFGDLRVRVGGATCSFPVGLPDGAKLECGGYDFEIVEFQTAFQVGGPSSASGPLTNPMIKVAITAPDGTTGEKILFAFHPDFSMGHSGGEEDFANLDAVYSLSSGVEFAQGGASGLQARASFPVNVMDMNGETTHTYQPGEVFEIQEQMVYMNDEADFSMVPVNIMSSVILKPSNSTNTNLRPAARVTVRDQEGNEASAVCVKGEPGQSVNLGGQSVKLAFGPLVQKLPYSLFLDDFVLDTYPGSDNPATYESYVLLSDPEKGIDRERVHIYMNHPLTHRGSKHFQSSYDKDRRGTVLTLNHDPGKIPTYIGYTLIGIGFLLVMLQNLIWPRKKGENGTGEAKIAAALLAGVLAFGAAGQAVAQQGDDHAGHNHAAAPQASTFTVLSDPAREEASRLIIQDYRGRMKPLDTLAREFVMKVAKKTKFQDRHPVDMYLNWVANPNQWWDQPCIAVRYAGLKDLLGVDSSVKHVSPASLFVNGQYSLATAVEEAHRTPDRERSKTQRKLISFDERFNLLYMTFRGSTLRMYPIPGDINHTWLDIQEVAPRLDPAQAAQYNAAYNDLINGVRSGNNAQIMQGIKETDTMQHQFGAEVIPSNMKMESELFYNRSHIFSWMMVPLLGCFFVFMGLFLWNLFKNQGAKFSFRNPIYSLAMAAYTFAFGGMILGYVLRWIASGRAPLSNGHESLLFISLAAALSGLIFEVLFRMSAPAGLASFLTVIILGVSMLSVFDPAIGPLVPVLVSYWLNIHVTIITASYAFLGLAFMTGVLIMFLMIIRGLTKPSTQANLDESIRTLDKINFWVLVVGLGTLTVGTLLGGVWANESWGRYWGWDPKETWSLVTILVAAIGLHFRYIPAMKGVWINSAWSWMVLNSVIMTYFGVNYFLVGLHSYASGDAARIPGWAYIFSGAMVVLLFVSGLFNLTYRDNKKVAG